MSEVQMTEEEMVEILEAIARGGSDTARIQAIKALRQIDRGEDATDSFDKLDELAQKRQARAR